jgi:dodecin
MVDKTIELTGVSANSIEEAVKLAVARAAITISGLHTLQIMDISAAIENDHIARWKVRMKLSFPVKEQLHE